MTESTDRRDQIRRAIAEADGFDFSSLEVPDYQRHVDAILALLPAAPSAPTDRTALRDRIAEAIGNFMGAVCSSDYDLADAVLPVLPVAAFEEALPSETAPKADSKAPDRAALRNRIRRAICEAEGFAWDSDMLEPDEYGEIADAVLSVLPATTDRATVLREAADEVARWYVDTEQAQRMRDAIAYRLRRMADETQQPERITLTRDQLAALLAHHADVLAAQLRTEPARDGWIAAERLDAHAAALTDNEEPPAVAELLDAIWTFPVDEPAVGAQQPKEA